MVAIGAAVLGLLAFTDYVARVSRKIPMQTYLTFDTVMEPKVAASTWLFGFDRRTVWPHLVFGFLEVGAGLLTQKQPTTSQA